MHVTSVCLSAARIHVGLFILMGLLTVGCGDTLSVKAQRDFGIAILPGVTWAWNPTPASQRLSKEEDTCLDNATIHGLVRDAIETVMGSKGFRLVEPAGAELLVNYRISVRSERECQQVPIGGLGTMYPTMRPMGKTKGVLQIDLLERSTGKLAFRSRAVGDIMREGASHLAIYATVTHLLEDLP